MRDDELNAALRDALLEPIPDVDERRVDALRAAVSATQRDATTVRPGPPAASERLGDSVAPPRLEDRRQRGLRFVPIAAVAAAILIFAGGMIALRSNRNGDTAESLEYAGPIVGPAGSGELRVVKTGIGRVVDLDTDALAILPTGEFYEIWFVASDDTPESPNRISAGSFHPDLDGRSHVTFAAAVDPTKFPTVEITAEPGDGNPAPSGPTVMSVDVVEQ